MGEVWILKIVMIFFSSGIDVRDCGDNLGYEYMRIHRTINGIIGYSRGYIHKSLPGTLVWRP